MPSGPIYLSQPWNDDLPMEKQVSKLREEIYALKASFNGYKGRLKSSRSDVMVKGSEFNRQLSIIENKVDGMNALLTNLVQRITALEIEKLRSIESGVPSNELEKSLDQTVEKLNNSAGSNPAPAKRPKEILHTCGNPLTDGSCGCSFMNARSKSTAVFNQGDRTR